MTDQSSFEPIFENAHMRMKACRHGPMLYNTNDTYIGRSFDLYGEYAESEMGLLANFVKPGMLALDVGANIGAHTIFLAKTVGPQGHVLAFEPQRQVFQNLCANVALNALGNIVTFHAGVGDQPGTAVVPHPNYQTQGNFGGVSLGGEHGGENIQIMSIDQVGLPALHFMKIDVEGMETSVLKGATQTISAYKPVLYVENDRKDKSPELLAYIFSLGYRAYWHTAPLYNSANHANNPENIFGSTISLNLLCFPAEVSQNIEGLPEVKSPDEFILDPS
ncbi:FkbM family methyltransferase [Pseudomonadota bacterium]